MMRRREVTLLALAFLCGGSYSASDGCAQQAGAAEKPKADVMPSSVMLGRNSCAATTCHGGPVGETVDWHSSLSAFEALDPHADAGLLLKNDLSRRMVETLHPESREAPEVFQRVIQDRCSGCHAPAMESLETTDTSSLAEAAYLEGVSCEACHGPAAPWLELHLRSDWKVGDEMRNTASFVERVEGCASCHIGSRQSGEPTRDMNHDMIAAGHPPLRFDAWAYLRRLPSHWDERNPRDDGLPVDDLHPQLRRFLLGRLIGMHTAVNLTGQRVRDAGRGSDHAVWPELADFDCFACHQRLRIANLQVPASPGFPRYSPWVESGISEVLTGTLSAQEIKQYQELLDQIRLRSSKSSDVSSAVTGISQMLEQPIQVIAGGGNLPPGSTRLGGSSTEGASQTGSSASTRELDWHVASFWFLQTQARLAGRQAETPAGLRTEFEEVHDLLRFRPLSALPGVTAESPAQLKSSEIADRLQRLNGASLPVKSP